jgi:CHAD domain-containing protein
VGSTGHSPDPEAIHDLRVAIRRFTQSLAVFKPCFVRKQLKNIRRGLKPVMTLAGEVRDYDIALEYLSKHASPESTGLQTVFQARRRQAERALCSALKNWVTRKTSSKWRSVLQPVAGAEGYSVNAAAQSAIPKLGKDFLKSGSRAAHSSASAGELHRFRIAAKKFRYTLELFAPLYRSVANEWLERIARLQSLLGRINDSRTVRGMVADIGDHKKIESALKKNQRRKTAEFRQLWTDDFASPAARHRLRALQSPPRKSAASARLGQVTDAAKGA